MFKDLSSRTKNVASTYTGTFIVVMVLNQLVFFGFCLNPVCLIAAMPHVLLITVGIGSWINKLNNWGKGESEPEPQSSVWLEDIDQTTPKVTTVATARTENELKSKKKDNAVSEAIAKETARHLKVMEQMDRDMKRDPERYRIFKAKSAATKVVYDRHLNPDKHKSPTVESIGSIFGEVDAAVEREPQAVELPSKSLIPADTAAIKASDQTSAGVYGSLSLELVGNWVGGYSCAVHTVSSKRTGQDSHGNPTYETTRSEMGQLVYDLKYAEDFSTVPQIVKLLRRDVTIEGFDCIIPVPASKFRLRQPVDAIAEALGALINVPVHVGFLEKAQGLEQKGLVDLAEREAALRGAITVAGGFDVAGRSVLLLDDLYRSGATLRACCDVLKDQGVGEIWVLTMTKTRVAT